MGNFPIWPEQASTYAQQVDNIQFALISLTVFFTTLVLTLLTFFAVRYRRGSKVSRKNAVDHDIRLELAWSILPLLIGLGMFVWAAIPYASVYKPPDNAEEIYVIGKQWMWHLQHVDTGIRENNELHIPVDRPFKLTLISQDVIHGFYVPEFRIKRDALPGAYNTCWFQPTKTGKFYLFCTEYCGTNHSQMGGWVYVMSPADYAEWVRKKGIGATTTTTVQTPAQQGEAIYKQLACGNCHGEMDTSRAPSLVGLYGRERKFNNGSTHIADRDYIRQAIINPENHLLAGYGQVTTMPSYKDQLDEDGINQLIAYIKSLGSSGSTVTTTSANPRTVPASHSGAPRGSNTTARKQP